MTRLWWSLALVVICMGVLRAHRLQYDLESYALLTRFADPRAQGILLRSERHPFTLENVSIPIFGSRVLARLYRPTDITSAPGLVIVHGIHHLGIDEPRLVNLSQAAAGAGFTVLTPQVSALVDYHVDGASIDTIGESAVWLAQHLGVRHVTVIGISFAGGLSLLAAKQDRYASRIDTLMLMGAYDDLARVSRFLATSQEAFPDGHTASFPAHDYGASVFVYAHLNQFFAPSDVPLAREALRAWMWEQPEKAQLLLKGLSPAGRATLDALLARRIDLVRPQILAAIQEDQPGLAALSPRGQMSDLKVPVFILHGSDDNIIPSSESLWLEQDIPRADLRGVLISPAFSHVDPKKGTEWLEELRLVHFLGEVLRAAN